MVANSPQIDGPISVPSAAYHTPSMSTASAGAATIFVKYYLEERGVIENKFQTPFRRKKLWAVDWSDEPEAERPASE